MKIDVQGTEARTRAGVRDVLERYSPKRIAELQVGENHAQLLDSIQCGKYSIAAALIEPAPGEVLPEFQQHRSYVFRPNL